MSDELDVGRFALPTNLALCVNYYQRDTACLR
jgi:hypothetical protein